MSIEMKAYQRQKMPGLVNVDRDDILHQDLPVGEEVPFVSSLFGDYTDSYNGMRASIIGDLEPELSRSGSHVVWVENARTGELMPVLLDSAGGGADDNGGDERDNTEEGNEEDENSPLILPAPLDDGDGHKDSEVSKLTLHTEQGENASEHSYAALFLRGLFLLFQGVLAGFNFISVSYLVLDDSSFLTTYQASANEVRRLSFVLSTLAALGAVDNLMSLISRSNRPALSGADQSTYGKNLIIRENRGAFMFAVCACFLYIASLVLTVLLGGTDTLIYYKFGVDDGVTDWVTSALANHAAEISSWRTYVGIRIAVAAFGWICSCYLVWKDLVSKDGRGHELTRMQAVISEWKHRVALMEGNAIEEMDSTQLRKLVAIQGLGFERTQTALRVVDQL